MYGILFFGTPHKGMYIEPFLRMVGNQPNRQLVRALAPGSQYLDQLSERFRSEYQLQDSKIITYYETSETQVAEVRQLSQVDHSNADDLSSESAR